MRIINTLTELKYTEIPIETPHLYKDTIKKYLLIYKARDDHRLLLLSKNAKKVFLLCNGKNTIQEIYSKLKEDSCLEKEVLQIISSLCKEKVLRITDKLEKTIEPIRKKPFIQSFSVWLHTTNLCNLRCPYCYIDKNNKESMPIPVAEKIILNAIEQCQKYNISKLAVKFAGGEPLIVWKNILHIIDFIRQKCDSVKINPTFSILSNGILIRKNIAQYLANNRIPISISLDGIGEVNYSQRFYKNGKGSFREIEYGIKILKEIGWKPFILITITDKNFIGMRKLTSYLLKNELSFRYSFVRNCSQMSLKDIFLLSKQYVEILHQCFDDIEKWMLTRSWDFNVKFCDINLDRSVNRACGIGKNSVAVNYNGDIALCQMIFNTPVGNADNNNLIETVYNQKIIPDLQERTIDDYLICSQCIWKNICAGGCPVFTYKQFGRFNLPSPYCHAFQTLIPRVIRLKGIKLLREYEKMKGGETHE